MMELKVDSLFSSMVAAGRGLGEEIWSQMETFVLPELKKIAEQIVAISANINAISLEGAQLLLQAQINAAVGVVVGMTELALLAVQEAINQILSAVRDIVNGALKVPLL